jgi:UDP-N-acetylmuramoyl-L-alanyl-D-glutamate--2,6-diaminopimelate ligase
VILSELIDGIKVKEILGPSDVEVSDISYSTDGVRPGSLFVAVRGTKADGHDFARDAVRMGAGAVVSERNLDLGGDATNVVVPDSRVALGVIAARACGDPTGGMKLFGVTGTNGKTTTTYMIESILRSAGFNPGVIGTVEYRFGGVSLPAPHTTPLALDLQRLLARMLSEGCDSCAMEVSSHALDQERVVGSRFDVGIFTNLTPEHLDYHDGMDDYFRAKAILFERLLRDGGKEHASAVINIDDPYGKNLVERACVPVTTFGTAGDADVRGSDIRSDIRGISMRVETPKGPVEIESKLRGSFNVQNMLAAIAGALSAGIDLGSIKAGVESLGCVPGRFEAVENGRDVLALVDYSHTPDALAKALEHAAELKGDGRLIAVFGCGGDRDRQKRPLMGAAAARLADVAIVTSDNPRTEEPGSIIEQILPGVREHMEETSGGNGYEVIADRRRAIARAVEMASPGDVIVVAGKGHEDYQILGTKKIHFDDREELAKAFGER